MQTPEYHDAMLRRLEIIKGMANDATRQFQTTLERKRAMEQDRLEAQTRLQADSYNMQPPQAGISQPGGNFGTFMKAISGKESSGNYRAVNPHSGALGKYQVMPGNVSSWSQRALGRSVSPQQFLNSPDIQERVAQTVLKGYYDRYGAAGAAVAWYAGEGTAKKWSASNGAGYNATQNYKGGKYPSVNDYANDILRRMRAI